MLHANLSMSSTELATRRANGEQAPVRLVPRPSATSAHRVRGCRIDHRRDPRDPVGQETRLPGVAFDQRIARRVLDAMGLVAGALDFVQRLQCGVTLDERCG